MGHPDSKAASKSNLFQFSHDQSATMKKRDTSPYHRADSVSSKTAPSLFVEQRDGPPRQSTDLSLGVTSESLEQIDGPPFQPQEDFYDILDTQDGRRLFPEMQCAMTKGFFRADHDWTCYRLNCFAVTCSFSLMPDAQSRQLVLVPQGGRHVTARHEIVRSMVIGIGANVEEGSSEEIELLQHTPKHKEGPMHSPEPIVVYQNPQYERLSIPDQHIITLTHIFERIQFKKATANDGKRRAA